MSSLKDSYRFIGPQPIGCAKFPAFVRNSFLKPIKFNDQWVPRAHPRRIFPGVTSEGVYRMLVPDWFWRDVWPSCFSRAWLVMMYCFGPSSFRAPYKLEQLPCQLRLLCKRACGVRCVCATKVQKRQYHESTCRWRLAWPWRPYYTLQSNFRLFGEWLRLFTGRGG